MRSLRIVASLVALLAASPSAAQLSNRSISVESGLSAPARGGRSALVPVALSAATWLEGGLHGTARIAWAFAPGTGGRGADRLLSGTFGLRVAPGADGLRPELLAEVGWAREGEGGRVRDGIALGLGGGLEWFPARDLSLSVRAVLRRAAGAWRGDAGVAASAYF